MDYKLLTTGDVARLCGVTADAVLKWIKSGKLPATRTPGGHYRVSRADLNDLGIGHPSDRAVATVPVESDAPPGDRLRCWEYFSSNGAARDACRTCLVYQSRAQNCYRLAELGERVGHSRNFCPTGRCEDCPFFRAEHGLATSVLIVTDDEALRGRLERQIDTGRVSVRFALSGYEASAAVGDLCPALIVLDSGLTEVRNGALPEMIRRDARIPGARFLVGCREGDEETVGALGLPSIPAPFTARVIEEAAASRGNGRGERGVLQA